MKFKFFGIIAIISLLGGCANLPSQDAWNTLTGQDNRSWGYAQTQAAEQAKAIFSQSFNGKGRGRTYSRNQIQFDKILLPPNSLNTLKLRTYCMDKSDPAPKRNEKLHLVPVGKLIDRQIFPIYQSLMKYSHSHPEKHTQVQRIVWNLRSTKNPSEMRNEDYALLDTISPGASQVVRSYFNTKNLTGMATDFLSDTAGKFLNQQGLGTNLLNQQNLVSTALHSISQSNSQVDSILRSLESMPVSGLIPNDNSDYSLLTNGVAVKATHRGGARNSELTIRNTNDYPVAFQPAQFALESKRKTQRLGVGGVDKIKSDEGQHNKKSVIYPRLISRDNIHFDYKVSLETNEMGVMEVRTRDRYLGIEINSNALVDGAYLRVSVFPLDKNGNIIPTLYSPRTLFKKSNSYIEVGGHNAFGWGKNSTIDGGGDPYGAYGKLWRIHLPSQQAVNDSSDGVDINVEYNPLR
jgi:hypothetical protein